MIGIDTVFTVRSLLRCMLVLCVPVEFATAAILHLRVPMRDGIHLDTNVFPPPGPNRFPSILVRTPYNKGSDLPQGYSAFIDHNYAVVLQDVRGRYGSEGTFDGLDQEGPDGYDTLSWIARQPWSNGKVAMLGGSYVGIAQWKVALLNHPALKAIFPVVSGSDDYLDRFYSSGGGMKLGHRLLWFSENLRAPGFTPRPFREFVEHLPLKSSDRAATGQTLPLYQHIMEHPSYDAFWKNLSVKEKLDQIRIPVFAVGGWYDNYVESDLAAFSILSRQPNRSPAMNRILIGPWPHNMSLRFDGIDFGQDSSSPIRAYQISWFDHWLKGTPETGHRHSAGLWHETKAEVADAPMQIFVMGVNRWRAESEWPLARTRPTAVYLSSRGHANSLSGDGTLEWQAVRRERSDTFVYDPRTPVPTLGGAICCNPKVFPWGPMDQRRVEARVDVLVYTSKPLKNDLEVTGTVRLVLAAATSAPDTDFTGKLVDVFPGGEARNITDGMLRMRYRSGLEKPILSQAGSIYPLTIDMGVTSNVFLAGHRIRLEVSSSNFPRFDRNPNTGRPIAEETSLVSAKQTVWHGRRLISYLVLPVIPELISKSATRYPAKRPSPKNMSYQAR